PEIPDYKRRHCELYQTAASLFARESTFATDGTCQRPPRCVRMPRLLSCWAIETMPTGPADWMLRMIGMTFLANRSASACCTPRPTLILGPDGLRANLEACCGERVLHSAGATAGMPDIGNRT